MLNLHCNKNDKKIGASWTLTHIVVKDNMGCKSTVLSTRLWSSIPIGDKNICYMQQVVNREKRSAVSVNNGA